MSRKEGTAAWADAQLMRELDLMLAAGETQSVEFKARFPKQLSDLGKEIAAFATSNAGTILLGVADDGTVAGLEGCGDRGARQELRARIEGLCANAVKPSVTPTLRFAEMDGLVVAAIDVPKGRAPLYYSQNIPYLRQVTAARPMNPEEVVEAVLSWEKKRRAADKPSPESEYLSLLATALVDVIARATEMEEREFGEWLRETRSYLGAYAGHLRDLAAAAPAECSDTVEPLRNVADQLDIAAHEQLTMDSGFEEMRDAAKTAVDISRSICARFLKPEFFNAQTMEGLDENIVTIARKQDDLVSRIDRLLELYKMDELRSEASANGLDLRRVAAFLAILGQAERGAALDAIGARLREIETRSIYMDGGRSQQAIVDDLSSANRDLQAIVKS